MQANDPFSSSDPQEISLAEVITFFQDYWKQIVLWALVAALGGLVYVFIDKPKYKASVALQLGRVANVDVEAPPVMLEKLLVPSSFSPSTLDSCGVDGRSGTLDSMSKVINPAISKTSSTLTLSVIRPTVSEARACLEAALQDIRSIQSDSFQGMMKAKQAKIAELRRRLDTSEQALRFYPTYKQQHKLTDEQIPTTALLLYLLAGKQGEADTLRAQINDLELALTEPQTRQASFATPINASNVPVGPSKPLIVIAAMLVGAVLATLYLMVRRSLRGGQVN